MKHLAVIALVALVACSKDRRQEPPLAPGRAPRHLAAVVTLPSIDQARIEVTEMLEGARVNAGALQQPLPAWTGLRSLLGVERAAPAHLVVLEAPRSPPATVVVVRVTDASKLQAARGATIRVHGGWAAIGERKAVEVVAPWALFELISRPPPTRITIQLVPAALVRAHEELRVSMDTLMELDMEGDDEQVGMALMKWAGAMAFARSSSATITIEPTRDLFAGEITVTPTPGSPFASLVQAQRPATFELLSRLPTGDHAAVLAGRVTLGPLRAELLGTVARMMVEGTGDPGDLAPFEAFFDTTTGEFAAATDQAADSLMVLYGISDVPAAERTFAILHDLVGPDDTIRIGDATFARWRTDDGDTLHGFRDHAGALLIGPDAEARVTELVAPDRARFVSPAPPPNPGDMLLLVTHEEGFTRTFAIGVAGGNLTLRWSMPPAAVKTGLQALLLAAY